MNDALTNNPDLKKYVTYEEEFRKYSHSSGCKVHAKCPLCGYIKLTSMRTLTNKSFSCDKCSDKRSYPNKFMFNLLSQLNMNFIPEKSFEWSNGKIYDFYLPKHNLIIEMHGGQHYKKGFSTFNSGLSLEHQEENDKLKKTMATDNGINKYIVIDSSESNLKYIKKSILDSKLIETLSFESNQVSWFKCDEYGNKNIIKEICVFYENNKHMTTSEIGQIYGLSKNTIISYLKKGEYLSWCSYNPKENMAKNGINNSPFKDKKIVCLEYPNIVFKNAEECSLYIKKVDNVRLLINSIRRVASGERKSYKRYHFSYVN